MDLGNALRASMLSLLLAGAPSRADEVTIKLATLAPQGSTWHLLLKDLGERTREASGGAVKLKIYAGGTQGSEGDMVRKLGVGQLQAASLSNVGLHDIAPESMIFSAPGMMDPALVSSLLPSLAPRMEQALEARGFVVLHWAQVGTVRLFCTKPYRTPEEAAEARFFAWDGDPGSVEAFRAMGFRPVVLAPTDIIPSLQTGMITCVTQVPAYVLATRIFEKANSMIDFPWAYLVAATVVRKDVWERVPPEVQRRVLTLAHDLGARVDQEVRRLDRDAVEAMKGQGLGVVEVDPVPWQRAAERAWPVARGRVVPADFFDEVVSQRAAALRARAGR
jgi:TRAP-type C4-dicarboxylate transport system substrate-binding protein